MDEETFYQLERRRMVKEQLSARNIRDARVLEAMEAVPRHRFVPEEHRHLAYSDGPLPIGSGQTISQPYIVALMTQLLRLDSQDKVLEIGTGSGYQAAVLAYLAREVHTVERHKGLAEKAIAVLGELNVENVHVHIGDGSLGLPAFAPFQAILVAAAAPEVPSLLLEQLDEGGRLVLPVGDRQGQYLERWRRRGADFSQEVLAPVAFVPLLGKFGWKEGDWENY
ncbi:MAG TPA: protein-L-isoaspartate(D-aspartate) O-methyltransferase [Anaerolineales bacterium]|nr:protein-L-isoaspartate(D-aspartate) O-methyltransferase [Anaerolineales bacterium]